MISGAPQNANRGETSNVLDASPRPSCKPIPNYLKTTLSFSGHGANCRYPSHRREQACPLDASCVKPKTSIGGARSIPTAPQRINPKNEKTLPKAAIKSNKAQKPPPMLAETSAKRRKIPTRETSTMTKPMSISRKLREEKLAKISTHAEATLEEKEGTAGEETKESKCEESEQKTPEESSTADKEEEKSEPPNVTSAQVPTTICDSVEEVLTEPRHRVKALAGAFQNAMSSLQQQPPRLLTRCGSKAGEGGQFGQQPTGVELKGGNAGKVP